MDTQHTPGPWHWEADEVKNDPYGRIRYQVTALGKTVTRVFYSTFEGGPTNADADARLIAAAPDHHAVALELRRLMLVIESAVRHSDPKNHAAVTALLIANVDAIEKATGVKT